MAITASHAAVRTPLSFSSTSSSSRDTAVTSSLALHTSRCFVASKPPGASAITAATLHAGALSKTTYLGRQLSQVRATQSGRSGGHKGRGGLVTRNAGTVVSFTTGGFSSSGCPSLVLGYWEPEQGRCTTDGMVPPQKAIVSLSKSSTIFTKGVLGK